MKGHIQVVENVWCGIQSKYTSLVFGKWSYFQPHNHMAIIYLRLQTLVPKISVTGRAQVIGEMPRHALFWSTLMNNLTQLCPPASLAILQAWWRLTLTDRQEVTTRSLNHLTLRFTGNSDDEKFHSTFSEGRRRRGCLPGSKSSQKLRLRVAVDLLRVVADTEWKWMQFFYHPTHLRVHNNKTGKILRVATSRRD